MKAGVTIVTTQRPTWGLLCCDCSCHCVGCFIWSPSSQERLLLSQGMLWWATCTANQASSHTHRSSSIAFIMGNGQWACYFTHVTPCYTDPLDGCKNVFFFFMVMGFILDQRGTQATRCWTNRSTARIVNLVIFPSCSLLIANHFCDQSLLFPACPEFLEGSKDDAKWLVESTSVQRPTPISGWHATDMMSSIGFYSSH